MILPWALLTLIAAAIERSAKWMKALPCSARLRPAGRSLGKPQGYCFERHGFGKRGSGLPPGGGLQLARAAPSGARG